MSGEAGRRGRRRGGEECVREKERVGYDIISSVLGRTMGGKKLGDGGKKEGKTKRITKERGKRTTTRRRISRGRSRDTKMLGTHAARFSDVFLRNRKKVVMKLFLHNDTFTYRSGLKQKRS